MLPLTSLLILFILDGLTAYFFFTKVETEAFILFILLIITHAIYASIIIHGLMRFFPIKEGKFSTSSPEFFRWQAQAIIYLFSAIYFDPFIPYVFKAPFYRFFGAKIGKGVPIGGRLIDISLISIKDHAAIGADAMILAHLITNDEIIIGQVIIEEQSLVGAKALISPGVTIKQGATVGAMAFVTAGRTIPANEIWIGCPAKPI